MNHQNVEQMEDVIAYIEEHLVEKPELEQIAEADLLTEFGYPTQRMVLQNCEWKGIL